MENALELLLTALRASDRRRGAFPGIFRDDGDGERFVHVPAMDRANRGVVAPMSLRTPLPQIADALGGASRIPTPTAEDAGQTRTLADEVLARSRVLRAGAHLIEIPTLPVSTQNGVPILQDTPSGLIRVDPATFAKIAETDDVSDEISVTSWAGDESYTPMEGEVTASTVPVSIATVDRDTAPAWAVRFTVPRVDVKARGMDRVLNEIVHAIAMGLGRVVDVELTAAILAETPSAFTLGAAATAGLNFAELRALVGTAGAGGAVDRGALFVSGIPAELTDAMSQTLVGAWNRAGVAVLDDLEFSIDKRSIKGGITVTCWANFQPLLPDPSTFWAVT